LECTLHVLLEERQRDDFAIDDLLEQKTVGCTEDVRHMCGPFHVCIANEFQTSYLG
jgi:hypothetical protein